MEPCLIRCYPGRPRWSLIRAFIRSLIRRVPNSKPSAFEGRGFGSTFIRSFIRRFIRALSGLIRTVFPLPPPPSKALLRTYMHTYMPFLPFPRASWRLIRNKRGAYPEPRRNERNRVRHPFIRLYPARLRQALSIRVFAYPAIIRGLSCFFW